MPINYNYLSNSDKYGQLYRLYELLRLEHNKKGEQLKNNIITKQEYDNYIKNDFEPKHELIINEILKYRTLIKNDTQINTGLNDVII